MDMAKTLLLKRWSFAFFWRRNIEEGVPEGEVVLFAKRRGGLLDYLIKEDQKHAEEWVYYANQNPS